MDASHAYVRAWALGCFHSHISTQTFRRALTASLDSCEEIKIECPFSGVNKSGKVWRKVPESDTPSVQSPMPPAGLPQEVTVEPTVGPTVGPHMPPSSQTQWACWKKVQRGMGSQDWNVWMVGIQPRNILWGHYHGHAGLKGIYRLTEQIDWRSKQPSQVACISKDLKCWGAWNYIYSTSQGHHAIYRLRDARERIWTFASAQMPVWTELNIIIRFIICYHSRRCTVCRTAYFFNSSFVQFAIISSLPIKTGYHLKASISSSVIESEVWRGDKQDYSQWCELHGCRSQSHQGQR